MIDDVYILLILVLIFLSHLYVSEDHENILKDLNQLIAKVEYVHRKLKGYFIDSKFVGNHMKIEFGISIFHHFCHIAAKLWPNE